MNDDLFKQYQQTQSPHTLAMIVKREMPTMNKFIGKYQSASNLPAPVIKSHGKKFMIKAIKTYDPDKGASFATHLNRNLMPLNRVNYETSNVFRMSEELQMGANVYKSALDEERDRLGREPSSAELADKLGWSMSKVERVARQMVNEVSDASMSFDPAVSVGMDNRIDYVYYDLPEDEKLIMQYKTGYAGAQKLNNKQISKKMGISESSVSQKTARIARKIKNAMRI